MYDQSCLFEKMKIEEGSEAYTYQLSPYNAELLNINLYLSQAILLEVSTSPKPGLVTKTGNGSHKDMSIMTFMMSSAVLSKAFYELQAIGLSHDGSPEELMKKVRGYGIGVEKELLSVTKGVNTQRGILFAGGVLSAAAGYASSKNLPSTSLIDVVKAMTKGIVAKELKYLQGSGRTYGEKLYEKYGITGIRGEIENGFPSVINYGLPALREAFAKQANINDALIHALLNLMAVVEDSNVLWRSDWQTAQQTKRVAKEILMAGSVFTEAGRCLLQEACHGFEKLNISPGGSADLLSITIALYLLENKEFPCAIL